MRGRSRQALGAGACRRKPVAARDVLKPRQEEQRAEHVVWCTRDVAGGPLPGGGATAAVTMAAQPGRSRVHANPVRGPAAAWTDTASGSPTSGSARDTAP